MLSKVSASLHPLYNAAAARYVAIVAPALICLLTLLSRALTIAFYDPSQCLSMAQDGGFWLDPSPFRNDTLVDYYMRFQPHNCIPFNYTWADVNACMGGEKVVYVGDSTVVNPYAEFVNLFEDFHGNYFIEKLGPLALTHAHIAFHLDTVEARYDWEVFLDGEIEEAWHTRIDDEIPDRWNSSGQHEMAAMEGSSLSTMERPPFFMFIGTGLWELRANQGDPANTTRHINEKLTPWLDRLDVLDEHTDVAHDASIVPRTPGFFYLNPLQLPEPSYIPQDGNFEWLSYDRVKNINKWLKRRTRNNVAGALAMFTFNWMTPYKTAMNPHDGQHAWPEISRIKNNLMLNHRCNHIIQDKGRLPKPSHGMCCIQPSIGPFVQWMLMLLTPLFLLAVVLSRWDEADAAKEVNESTEPARLREWMRQSTSRFQVFARSHPMIMQILPLALATCLCILADRTFLFATQQKYYSFRLFIIYNALVFFSLIFTQSRIDSPQPLPESILTAINLPFHTDEWKGWLTLVACGVDYFAPTQSATLQAVYDFISAAFIFLFAFGTTRSFLNSEKTSTLVQKLIRLNLLSVCLAVFVPGVAGVAMLTYTFMLTTCALLLKVLVWRRLGHEEVAFSDLLIPIVSLAMVLLIHHFTGVLSALADPVSRFVRLTFPSFSITQTLNICFVAFHFGYVAALLLPHAKSSLIRGNAVTSIYAEQWNQHRGMSSHRLAALGIFAIFAVGIILLMPQHLDLRRKWIPGFANNFTALPIHETILTSAVPIVGLTLYPALRAMSPIRHVYSPVMAWIGYHSLEIYLLRQHLWLGNDGSALTRLTVFDTWIPAGPFGRRIFFILRTVDMLVLGCLVLYLASLLRYVDAATYVGTLPRLSKWMSQHPFRRHKTLDTSIPLNGHRDVSRVGEMEDESLLVSKQTRDDDD